MGGIVPRVPAAALGYHSAAGSVARAGDALIDHELPSLVRARGFTRRDFVRTAVGSGCAAAVRPVPAQTVRTTSDGLQVGQVLVPVEGSRMPAYRAAPAGKAGAPVVLVASEIFGVHEYIADVCRRLALQGWFAIAPELFVRQGDAAAYGEVARLVAELTARTPDAQVVADLDACVAWAGAEGADSSRLGITGFGWGGRAAWMYAAHQPGLKAGVAWYGPVARAFHAGDRTALDLASRIKTPMLGLYGAADGGIPNDTVSRMRDSLVAAGNVRSEIVLYPDTPHAFHADYRPTYRKAQAEDGWKRCLAWLRANGAG